MLIAEPTFIASLNGLCGFILVIEEGEVDAYTPSGKLLGVYHDRVQAAEAVLMLGAQLGSTVRVIVIDRNDCIVREWKCSRSVGCPS